MGQAYVNFMRNCIDQIRSKVLDELWILTFFEVRIGLNSERICNYNCTSRVSREKSKRF